MSQEPERPAACLNCAHPLSGGFCSQCGQKAVDLNRPFQQLLVDLLGDLTAFDSRVLRTIKPFVLRPGFLAMEYATGRRVHYVPPFRLYIFVSALFFITAAFTEVEIVKITTGGRGRPAAAAAETETPPPPSTPPPAETRAADGTSSKLRELFSKDPKKLNALVAQRLPQVLFLFLPLFALLLKLFYVRHGTLYIQHLVFSAYFHAFSFLVAWIFLILVLLEAATGDRVQGIVMLLMGAHLFLALRRVYEQSRLMTFVKVFGIFVIYSVVVTAGLAVTAVLSALSL